MIIHTYATNGYTDWLNFFLESLKYQHGEKWKIIIDGRDLSEGDTEKIEETYGNVEIKNKEIDYECFMQRSELDKDSVFKSKRKTEKSDFQYLPKGKEILGKQFISVEDRYRNTIIDTINENRHEDFIFHFDADTYVRKPITPLIDLVYKNDISLILREERPLRQAIHGCFMAFRICPEIDYFFEVGREIIDGTPLKKKSRGFGQSSCWEAYLETKNYYNGGKVPREGFFNKKPKAKHYRDSMVGTGCKGKKGSSLEIGKKDFEKNK